MLKLIETDSAYFHDEPNIRILDTSSAAGLTKQAADAAISEYASKIVPSSDKVYVHILAMGASETWGANRNADSFPEANLVDYHKTFETSPAHIFRNHVNKNPEIAIGQVVFSTYNSRMKRVEVIAWIDKTKGADIVDLVEQGKFPPTSMACKTPYDVCSICGNKAHTRQEYCEHLTGELGRIYPDGRKVSALNLAPLKFFDMSIVVRPADVTSAVLQKVANYRHVIGSAEMADAEGLTEKSAAHRKLSELVKEIEDGHLVDTSDSLQGIMNKVSDPHPDTIPVLSDHSLPEVLNAMAHLGISPSLGYLADLIGHQISGPDAVGVGDLVEGYIGANGLDKMPVGDLDPSFNPINPSIINTLAPHIKSASLFPEYVSQRSVIDGGDMYIPGTGVGFSGNGHRIEETPQQRYYRMAGHPAAHESGGLMGMIKTLVMIGGAALAAKWYITREIERKSGENANAHGAGVKIVLVKSASDYRSTYRLAKYAMAKAIQKS